MIDNVDMNLKRKFYDNILAHSSKLDRILQVTGLGLWELDIETKDSYWTEETFQVFGLASHPGPISLDTIMRSIHPQDRQRTMDVIEHALAKPIDVEYRIIRPDGTERYVRSQAAVEINCSSPRIIGTIQDITEQRKTELKFQALFQFARDAIVIFDDKGAITAWNEGAQRIFGYSESEIVGESLRLIIPERFREAYDQGIQHYLSTGQIHLIDQISELVGLRKDGQEFPIEISLAAVGAEGNTYFAGIIRDITKRKENERLLKFNKERYESLKRYNPIGICSLGSDGRVLGANPAFEKVTGYSLDELREMDVLETILYPEDIDWARNTLLRTLVERIELTIKHKSGRRVEVSLTNVPIIVDNDPIGMYIILSDVTQQNRVQRKLHETQHVYNLMAENSHDVITYCGADGICRYASPSIRNLLGYEPEEVVGQLSVAFYHPDDIDYIQEIGRRILLGEDIERFTCRVRCKNGAYIWCETTLKIVRDKDGNLLEIVGVGRDVSKHIELQESLEHAVRIAGLGHWEWDIRTGTITMSNHMHTILGNPMVKYPFTYDQFMALVHPDDVELLDATLKRTIQTTNHFDRVFRIIHPDGSIRFLHGQGELILDETGVPYGMFGTYQDITEQKRFEQEIRESEQRYRRLVDNTQDAIGIHDGETWMYMNEPGLHMFGALSEDEVIGKSVYDFLPPDDHAIVKQRIHRIICEGVLQISKDQAWMAVDGNLFYSDTTGLPIDYHDKSCVQVIVRDITEKKESEALLISSEKLTAVGQLAAGIAHEIRNPLTALKGFTQLLHVKSEGEDRQYFEIMMDELDRIELILNELLALGKPQALAVKPVGLELILYEVITLLTAQAAANTVVLETEIEDGIIVECDPNKLKQVFINILKNAIEAMPTGGHVFIRLVSAHDKAHVEFIDNGPGIPPEQLDKLGTAFFTTKERGTGLGFLVSRKIIESHNGSIHVSSHLGNGTTMRVVLNAIKESVDPR